MPRRRVGCFLTALGLASLPGMAVGAQGRAPGDSLVRTLVTNGDAAWWRGAHDSAYALYRRAVAHDTARAAATLVRLAALEVERDRVVAAASLLRARLRLAPGDDDARVALARVLAWDGRYDDAIALYGEVLARDSTHHDAALGRAQALSWAGRLDEAERGFMAVARRHQSPEAERGLARVSAWRGDLTRSERLWRSLTTRVPNDAENWIGLAQVQYWAGRAAAADSAIRRALALDSSSVEARRQAEAVQSALRGAAEPVVQYSRDSDGNRSTSWSVGLRSGAAGALRWQATATWREAALAGLEGTSAGARAGVAWSSFDRRWQAAAAVGATRLSSRGAATGDGSTTVGSALARVSRTVRRGATVGLTLSRSPFDETAALIASGIVTSAVDVDGSFALPGGVALAVSAGRAAVGGGRVPNARRTVMGALRWPARPRLVLGATVRGMACDTSGGLDGYFCPDGFWLAEAGAGVRVGDEAPWSASLDAGAGRQFVRLAPGDRWRGNTAVRARVGVRFQPRSGYAVEAGYGASTVASPFAQEAAEYSARVFSLAARVRL